MMGDISLIGIFHQIFELVMVPSLSFTKHDIDEMFPYERMVYVDMVHDYKKQKEDDESDD
jgi:hypothetical protein